MFKIWKQVSTNFEYSNYCYCMYDVPIALDNCVNDPYISIAGYSQLTITIGSE